MSKKLVAYFSASGVTAKAAKGLASAAGADVFAIEPAEPYTDADLDWKNKQSRSTVEMQQPASRPALKKMADLATYETLYIGFPIWWGVAPHIIKTFLDTGDFRGKKIMLFATSGGSGIEKALTDLRTTYPKLDIVGGKRLAGAVTADIL